MRILGVAALFRAEIRNLSIMLLEIVDRVDIMLDRWLSFPVQGLAGRSGIWKERSHSNLLLSYETSSRELPSC